MKKLKKLNLKDASLMTDSEMKVIVGGRYGEDDACDIYGTSDSCSGAGGCFKADGTSGSCKWDNGCACG